MDNEQIARRWFHEVWNEKKESTIFELLHPEAIGHTSAGEIKGPDAWKARLWDVIHGAFSNVQLTVEDAIGVGEKVVVRWRCSMKHAGPFYGVKGSGASKEISGITWLIIRDGKMVEGWDGWDSTALLLSCGGASLHPTVAAALAAAQ